MRLAIVATVLVLATGWNVAEDQLILKDGQVVTGKILALGPSDVQIEIDGVPSRVPRWAIERIEREDEMGEVVEIAVEEGALPANPRTELPTTPLAIREFPEATTDLLAWVDLCVEHLGSPDKGVRTSATAALRFVGPAARPALERAVANGDENRAGNAARVLRYVNGVEHRIEKRKAQEEAAREARSPAAAMGKGLGVSEAQFPLFKAAVDKFYDGQAELAAAVRAGRLESDEAARRVEDLRVEFERDLAGVLTEEQIEQYRRLAPRTRSATPDP